MAWVEERSLLSPAQERQWWMDKMKQYPSGMAVNCRHMPSLDKTPVLRKLIEDGHILRVREKRGKNSARTVLKLPE